MEITNKTHIYCPTGELWWAKTHAYLPTVKVMKDRISEKNEFKINHLIHKLTDNDAKMEELERLLRSLE